jgi:hypothetical protein
MEELAYPGLSVVHLPICVLWRSISKRNDISGISHEPLFPADFADLFRVLLKISVADLSLFEAQFSGAEFWD